MEKIKNSWKGTVTIEDTAYIWEQFATDNTQIIMVKVLEPIQLNFEFEPQKMSIGKALQCAIEVLK